MKKAALVLAIVGCIHAQSGRSYGPGNIWWNSGDGGTLPWAEEYDTPDGQVGIYNKNGAVRTKGHAFFEALGSNGRACITCHQPSNGMGISAATVQGRWTETSGRDPLFAAVDGSNCPDLPQADKASHSLLLDRGLVRIALAWPPRSVTGAAIRPEFQIEVLRDPARCNTSPAFGLTSKHPAVSVYRRPRTAANLNSAVADFHDGSFMADGREPTLASQAITAILVHEQAQVHPTPEAIRQIVDFETQIYTAQSSHVRAGLLNEKQGPPALGPENLADGKVDAQSLGHFDIWRKPNTEPDLGVQLEFRASVARGSDIFLKRSFRIAGSESTCATCHQGTATRSMDIGTTNTSVANALPDLPLFRITCESAAPPHATLGRLIYTQDPGRALITGKCADVGSITMQQFHALSARAPYFSNGSARTLRDLVDFYDARYSIKYSEREKLDLVNFLNVL